MKRFIKASDDENILFDSIILFDVEVPTIINAASIDRFPGSDKFLRDVVTLLKETYKFDVISDKYDGVNLSEGHVSNRDDSSSVYIDTYYNLANSGPVLESLGVNITPPSGSVKCFIHLRFSDHPLYDAGDVEHINYINNDAAKYTDGKDIDYIYKEELVTVLEDELQLAYSEALESLAIELDSKILEWVRKARRDRSKSKS